MQPGLVNRLVKDKLLSEETLIYCFCTVIGLGQHPQRIKKELLLVNANEERLLCRDKAGKQYNVVLSDVLEIDGMTPLRYAAAYDIAVNGSNRPVLKKRGRKPKSHMLNMLGDLYGENQFTDVPIYSERIAS